MRMVKDKTVRTPLTKYRMAFDGYNVWCTVTHLDIISQNSVAALQGARGLHGRQ